MRDIDLVILRDLSDDPIVTVRIVTPLGTLTVMGELQLEGDCIILQGLHIGGDLGAGWGQSGLRRLARLILEELDVDEIRITGAIRTTGANPGRRPRPVRIARQPRASPRSGFKHA